MEGIAIRYAGNFVKTLYKRKYFSYNKKENEVKNL